MLSLKFFSRASIQAIMALGLVFFHLSATHAAEAASATAPVVPLPNYYEALKALPAKLKGDAVAEKQVAAILAEARVVRDLPLVTRAVSLEEMKNPGTKRIGLIDSRAYTVEKKDPAKANLFAIAMADVSITGLIAREMPLLAAAYVITGDRSYLDRTLAQLRETSQWFPLQRPGWELYKAENKLPPDGNDGVWLATGQGLIAIWQTLEILPPGAVPPDLMAQLREQFKREAERITTDWQHKQSWFMRGEYVTSNQWIVPASGLAVACAVLGRDANPVAYDLAITLLNKSIEGLGADGSVSEGVAYGEHWSGPYLYMAAQALAKAGDHRIASRPFFKNFPTWMALQFQPGSWTINSFDCFGAGRGVVGHAPDLAQLSVLIPDHSLAWTLRHVVKVLPYNFYGLLSLTVPESTLRQPPLSATFERGHCAVWRSSWDEKASGVWVRGGHALDFHDHWDRGHVNFIVDGKAILIESGTPGYDNPRKAELYGSVMGHNVLQIGDDLYPKKVPAPITVKRMDAEGGEVTVDAGAGYPTVASWQRRVVWTTKKMEITDTVTLKKPGKILFRWHLGSEQALKIAASSATGTVAQLPAGRIVFPTPAWKPTDWVTPQNSDWAPPEQDVMETPAASITVQADKAIVGAEEKNLDHCMRFRQQNHQHTTFVVRSTGEVESITLKTVVESNPVATAAAP